ncbi:MAG TPA: phosphoadenylyl-sulfate reductase [Acidimicrobiales bacterium]|nr:phosphoadenylyl-sulfate reductase [Acidimicrobiales bacterium]
MSAPTELRDELTEVDATLEHRSPREVLAWALERFDGDLALACSFEDVALLHMALDLAPGIEVLFLDTGGHFPETLEFRDRLAEEWSLNLTVTQPGPDADAWPCGSERCCELRKVEPLARALDGRAAWVTAVKRVDAPSRATMRVVEWDDKFSLVKVNPLAAWSDDDVAYYLESHGLPTHPLWAQGYASIGCAAVTLKPLDPGDRRSGRWAGSDKTECGLHEGGAST